MSDLPVPALQYRTFEQNQALNLHVQGLPVMLARLFAARGIKDIEEVRAGVDKLIPISKMKNATAMGELLADCVTDRSRVLIVSDYDCDGATAGSVLVKAFRGAGMNHDVLVPDRLKDGYGLTASIVEKAAALPQKPKFIITVDNGISSVEGVDRARELGIEVLVTDHHLCGKSLPTARLIVNPNQPGCDFPSKDIAGCGVAWYVAGALHAAMMKRGQSPGFNHEALLPFVAIGTIADIVKLDFNNRIMVREGLERIRRGECSPGIQALAEVANRSIGEMTCQDVGFAIGPRINAAGRLAHMSSGIECLTTESIDKARELAVVLDAINVERKEMQKAMLVGALEQAEVAAQKIGTQAGGHTVVVYDPSWHEGVVGIVAGRLKDMRFRPTFALCDAQDGDIKGSGRSVPGFHLKHALDEINIAHPGLLMRFGGHAMAAGVTIRHDGYPLFLKAFDEVCKKHLTEEMMTPKLEHDGALPSHAYNELSITEMQQEVWGQGFPEPLFVDQFPINKSSTMGADNSHLRINVQKGQMNCNVVAFGEGCRKTLLPAHLQIAFTPSLNVWQGQTSVQLMAKELLNVPRPTAEQRLAFEAMPSKPARMRP